MRIGGNGVPKKISDLFEVYRKRLRAPQGSVIDAATEVISDVLGVPMKREYLAYDPKSRILRVNASGPLKSEVSLRREEILNHLKGRLGTKSAPLTIL
jgi:hypothetical protein